jgi:hypothetical protein
MFGGGSLAAYVLAAAVVAPALTNSTVQQIENAVHLPDGAGPIGSYDRYYAPDVVSGRHVIVGLYLATGPGGVGRTHLLQHASDLPLGILDGGCEEIRVYWDVATSKVIGVSCNGVA